MPYGPGFIDFRFEVVGAPAATAKLDAWGLAIRDLSPAFEQVADYLEQQWAYNFAIEGGWVGKGSNWAPLAFSTVQDRLRRGFGGEHPILVRTGNLRESVTEKGGMGHVREVRPDGLTLGTQDPIAKFHQFGTRRMPARRLVGLTIYNRQEVVRIVGDYVREQARAAGLKPYR